ncbi:unnamed protein product [Urochloa humidicola]
MGSTLSFPPSALAPSPPAGRAPHAPPSGAGPCAARPTNRTLAPPDLPTVPKIHMLLASHAPPRWRSVRCLELAPCAAEALAEGRGCPAEPWCAARDSAACRSHAQRLNLSSAASVRCPYRRRLRAGLRADTRSLPVLLFCISGRGAEGAARVRRSGEQQRVLHSARR